MMVRIMIVALLLGSAFLGWRAWEQQGEIKRYEAALEPKGLVEKTVERIQKKAFIYTQYQERSVSEGIQGDGDNGSIAAYLRKRGQDERVLWGGLTIGAAKDKPVTVGKKKYTDTTYKITPQEKDQTHNRQRIANFFYLLERDSRKLKITDLEFRTAGKSKPEDVPTDLYHTDFTITVRERQ